jgi:Glycosyl hydrolases family 28
MNRREMLAALGLMAAGGPLFGAPPPALTDIKPGSRIFDSHDFGAAGDGKTLDTASINRAVDAAHAAGGGVVYLAPGAYLSGTVILRSNVTLYLEAGATLLGSKDVSDYTAQPGPPADADANQKHLVFARDAENVGVAGPGRIDGQGRSFWAPSDRTKPLAKDYWRDVVTYDWKPLPRPSPMLEFYNCKNLRIEDVQIENSPGWTLRPIHCDNVFIRGIHIKNPVHGPNTDGIDPTCCQNVFISDCLVETGDDAICLKSENPYGEELRVSKNITIANCVLSGCCNGFKFGTATRGGFENVAFTNSVIFNDDVPLNERIISGIALEMVDGGWLEGVVISNIRMQRARTPIFIRRANRHSRPDGTPGTLRGVMIENIYATDSILTSSVTGLPGFDVEDVTLSNIRIESNEGGQADWMNRVIPELPKSYPEARDFGRLPSYGFYCRHVTGLRLRNLEFKSAAKEERPAIVCDYVKNLDIEGLRSQPITGTQPVVKLVQCKQALIRGGWVPAGTQAFLEVAGGQSADIVLMNNNLIAAKQAVQSGAEVPKAAVTASGNVMKT